MIPVSEPLISKNAKKYVLNCLKTSWVSSAGSFVDKFETAFAKYIGTKYAVATSSGTSALHLSLAALNISKDDEIIVPCFTMIASVLPILYQNAKPVLVDCETNGNINVTQIEKKITKKTKAIIPVHIFGHPVDMDPILKLAKKYGLAVIEDAAEAHGAIYKDKKVGSIGDLGCFSFYGNKIITTGEGGIVTTNNKKLADRIRSLRNLARTKDKHFLHREVAFAYRMSNLQAALGLAELEEIEKYIKRKRDTANQYSLHLQGISNIVLPKEEAYVRSVFWQYGILLKTPNIAQKLEKYLAKNGIETRRFFVPMHKQPAFRKEDLFTNQHFPVAENLSKLGVCLPSGVAITNREIEFVANKIKKFFK